VLVLRTLAAPERRRLRGRRGRRLEEAEAEPVPTARATVVRPRAFAGREEAERWLAGARDSDERAREEVAAAVRRLNRALHAHRVAAADPYVGEVSAERALVVRLGFGGGDEVAAGRFQEAWEPPRRPRRTRRSMEAPEERFAAILGARERALAAEVLVLRARADLDAGRVREAALQSRVALESLLAEARSDRVEAELGPDRGPVGEAANAALRGELSDELSRAVADAVGRMEAALKRHRLAGD
jgi:hypothetical protein